MTDEADDVDGGGLSSTDAPPAEAAASLTDDDADEVDADSDSGNGDFDSETGSASFVDDTAFAIEDEDLDALFERHPELAIGLPVFVAAIAYAVITYVRDGGVNVLETAIFAVVFGLVWVFFRSYFGE